MLKYLPYEILAMTAECRLLKKSRYKFMVFDIIDVFLLQSSFAPTQSQPKFGIHIARVIIVHIPIVIGHFYGYSFKQQRTTDIRCVKKYEIKYLYCQTKMYVLY